MTCGIYCFTLRGTERCYVGSSKCVEVRKQRHLTEARRGSPHRFHAAIREFGETAFDFDVLAQCEPKELHSVEDFFMRLKGAINPEGFNVRTKASGGYSTAECSEATRERLRTASLGRPVSAETREKLSKRFTGRKMSKEARQKMSESAKRRGMSEKLRSAAAISRLGKKKSQEERVKISLAHRGKRCPEERRQRISVALLGRTLPQETRDKMRKAHLLRWSLARGEEKASV